MKTSEVKQKKAARKNDNKKQHFEANVTTTIGQ